MGYINGDNIPELFVTYGTRHDEGVCIYTYDPAADKAIYVGEFSSYGQCMYMEKKNRIQSTYGNNGYFLVTVSSIEDGKAKLVGTALSDASGVRNDSEIFYYNFDVPDWEDGTRDAFIANDEYDETVTLNLSEEHMISEEEYDETMEYLMLGPKEDVISVSYGSAQAKSEIP